MIIDPQKECPEYWEWRKRRERRDFYEVTRFLLRLHFPELVDFAESLAVKHGLIPGGDAL